MQLYNSPKSPFGARVVIAARVKGVDYEWLPIMGAELRAPAFRKVNPIGKIPVLLVEGEPVLPESETILRYLEDRFPEPSLMPASPEQRARVNNLIRVADLYVMAPVIRLFAQLDPATRDQRVVDYEVGYWTEGLAYLAQFMAAMPERPAAGLSLADCVLAPTFHLCRLISGLLGLDDLLAPHRVITDYYTAILQHPVVGEVLTALSEAQAGH